MGDPAGVGPELIVKLLQNKNMNFSVISSWWIDAGTEERIIALRELI